MPEFGLLNGLATRYKYGSMGLSENRGTQILVDHLLDTLQTDECFLPLNMVFMLRGPRPCASPRIRVMKRIRRLGAGERYRGERYGIPMPYGISMSIPHYSP